ncbi:hypothetical protein BDN72DRAFT_896941 [Pluteus cervinus]|uniref:Uncharacterized protein n=1 Tax=Pluteus cervinus TaxID=181527 RepID=A0ACD3AWZ4_9AGAR|nr:hypothetical protein BDN72DRAFT_896941 [Pluteus cervinus]
MAQPLCPLSNDLTERVPLEIRELVINQLVGDEETLRSCMLVCRAWWKASQRAIVDASSRLLTKDFGQEVNCAAVIDEMGVILYGTATGIYASDLANLGRPPVQVLNYPNIEQIDSLDKGSIIVFRSGTNVVYGIPFVYLSAKPAGAAAGPESCLRIYMRVTTFSVGMVNGSEILCLLRGKELHMFRRPASYSLRFLKAVEPLNKPSCIQIVKGKVMSMSDCDFELFDPQSLGGLGFVEGAQMIAIQPIEEGFLICYDKFAVCVRETGERLGDILLRWLYPPDRVVFQGHYILAFSHDHLEIRHVRTGELLRLIEKHFRLLSTTTSKTIVVQDDGSIYQFN